MINLFKLDLFDMEFIDNSGKEVTTKEWLNEIEGTWEFKHRILAPIGLVIYFAFFLVFSMVEFLYSSIHAFFTQKLQ